VKFDYIISVSLILFYFPLLKELIRFINSDQVSRAYKYQHIYFWQIPSPNRNQNFWRSGDWTSDQSNNLKWPKRSARNSTVEKDAVFLQKNIVNEGKKSLDEPIKMFFRV